MYFLLLLVGLSYAQVPANLSYVLWNYNSTAECDKRSTILDQNLGISDGFVNQALDCALIQFVQCVLNLL